MSPVVYQTPFGEVSERAARLLAELSTSEHGEALREVLRAGAVIADRRCRDPELDHPKTQVARGEYRALQALADLLWGDGSKDDVSVTAAYRATIMAREGERNSPAEDHDGSPSPVEHRRSGSPADERSADEDGLA